jgi:cyclopropane-fatty-acyl-phospholipid synthase
MNNLQPFFAALEKISFGAIEIELPNGEVKKFTSNIANPNAHIKIKNIAMIDECLIGGDVAFGESFINDKWESNNLPDLLLFLVLNSSVLERFFHAHKLRMFFLYLQALFRKNTYNGSKKNIQYHYDLGNNFYQLWLDETMTYSSALFDDENVDLSAAQKNKYHRILSKLNPYVPLTYGMGIPAKRGATRVAFPYPEGIKDKLNDKKNILEIGCGWGGFAKEAVLQGYNVTGLTLSKEQKKYADNLGLKNFTIKLQDYRKEKIKYDNIVSIEMFEAVGRQYWDTYFKTIKNCLNKDGKAIIQTITIDDEVALGYKKRVDFIQKHIFPGGVLPSKSEFINLAKANDLKVVEAFDFGYDYQKTLINWLDNFNGVKEKVINLGFDEKFIRKWQFYLAYCAAGFGAKRTSVIQFEITL